MRDGGERNRGEQVSGQGGSRGDCSGQRDRGRGQKDGGKGIDGPTLALKQSKRKGDKAKRHIHGFPLDNPSGIQEEVERKMGVQVVKEK